MATAKGDGFWSGLSSFSHQVFDLVGERRDSASAQALGSGFWVKAVANPTPYQPRRKKKLKSDARSERRQDNSSGRRKSRQAVAFGTVVKWECG